jgi:hypothetical protein
MPDRGLRADECQRVSPWLGALALMVSRDWFVRLAVRHVFALRDPGQPARVAPFTAAEVSHERERFAREAASLRGHLATSFGVTLFALLAAVATLVALGRVDLIHGPPVRFDVLCTGAGLFLSGWATYNALGVPDESYGRETLPELVVSRVFTALFVPGLILTFVGLGAAPAL